MDIEMLDEKVDTIKNDVGVILYILKGNGTEGLVTKVNRHDQFISGFIGSGKVLGLISLILGIVFTAVKLAG